MKKIRKTAGLGALSAALAGACTYQSSSYTDSVIKISTGTRSGAYCARPMHTVVALARTVNSE